MGCEVLSRSHFSAELRQPARKLHRVLPPLRNLPNDEVYLDLIDEMSPGVIKIPGPFLYVLMPMRLN